MTSVTIELPDSTLSALRQAPRQLAVEVRAYADSLRAGAQQEELKRAVARVNSPGELDERERELVTRALGRTKLVQSS